MIKQLGLLFLLIAGSFLFGCVEQVRLMQNVQDASYEPISDKAIIIFLRPQILALKVQAEIFDLISQENNLVGIVSAKEKLAYLTEPGNHLFMITGESADFMKADLRAGKIYYARIVPRIGVHKARFSLEPVHKDIEQSKLDSWKKSCKYIENTKDSYKWAQRNAANTQIIKGRYLPNWIKKPENEQSFLKPEDGF